MEDHGRDPSVPLPGEPSIREMLAARAASPPADQPAEGKSQTLDQALAEGIGAVLAEGGGTLILHDQSCTSMELGDGCPCDPVGFDVAPAGAVKRAETVHDALVAFIAGHGRSARLAPGEVERTQHLSLTVVEMKDGSTIIGVSDPPVEEVSL